MGKKKKKEIREPASRKLKIWVVSLCCLPAKRLQGFCLNEYLPFCGGVSLMVQTVKDPPGNVGDPDSISGREDALEKGMANPLQYSGLENPHGQRSLAGHRPRGCKESDRTE